MTFDPNKPYAAIEGEEPQGRRFDPNKPFTASSSQSQINPSLLDAGKRAQISANTPEGKAATWAQEATRGDSPFARQLLHGATLGGMPYVDAAAAAASTGIKNLFSDTPEFSASQAGSAMLHAQQDAIGLYEKNHPYWSTLGEVAGGVASPAAKIGGAAIKGAEAFGARTATKLGGAALKEGMTSAEKEAALAAEGVAGRWARRTLPTLAGTVGAAAVGSEWAGMEAALDNPEHPLEAYESAAAGGAMAGGGIYPMGVVAAKVLPSAAKAIGAPAWDVWQRAVDVFSGDTGGKKMTPAQAVQAHHDAIDWLHRIGVINESTPTTLRATDASLVAKAITPAEALGRPGVMAATGLARQMGETADKAESILRQRARSLPQNFLNDFQTFTGIDPRLVAGDFESVIKDRSPVTSRLYAAAETGPDGSHLTVDSKNLQSLLKVDIVKAAREKAADLANAARDTETEKVLRGGAETTGLVDEHGNPVSRTPPLTVRALDYIKKGLGDLYTEVKVQGGSKSFKSASIQKLARDIASEVDAASPAYRLARAFAGDVFEMQKAYEEAPKRFATGKTGDSVKEFAQYLRKQTPANREAVRAGVANHIYELAQRGKLGMGEFQTKAVQGKLNLMFGKSQASKLVKSAEENARLQATGSRIMPGVGSVTFEAADASGGVGDAAKKAASALVKHGPRAAVGNAIGSLISGAWSAGKLPVFDRAIRDEAGKLLLDNTPSQLAKILEQHYALQGTPVDAQNSPALLAAAHKALAAIAGGEGAVHHETKRRRDEDAARAVREMGLK